MLPEVNVSGAGSLKQNTAPHIPAPLAAQFRVAPRWTTSLLTLALICILNLRKNRGRGTKTKEMPRVTKNEPRGKVIGGEGE